MYTSSGLRRMSALGIALLSWGAMAAPLDVPPREEDTSYARQSSKALWSRIQKTGSLAVVGLKAPGQNRGIWQGKLLLTPEERTAAEQLLRDSSDVEVLWSDPLLPLVHARFESTEALARHRGMDHVDYIQPAGDEVQFFDEFAGCRNEPWGTKQTPGPLESYSAQYADYVPWNFKSHRIDQAWKRGNAGQGVKIGVTDTGVYAAQSQLWNTNDSHGLNGRFNATHVRSIEHYQVTEPAFAETENTYDDCSHGTRTVGTVGAPLDGDNTLGVAFRADLVSVRINSVVVAAGNTSIETARLGVRRAVDKGARIVEMAWGTTLGSDAALHDEISLHYYTKGVLFVGAAGTGGFGYNAGFVVSPAKFPEVIAVTGVTAGTMNVHPEAFYGPEVDVAIEIGEVPAPGRINGEIQHYGGTSDASAVVSGILGLIWSKYPAMTHEQVRDRLYWSAHNDGKPNVGHGKIDAYKALGGFMALNLQGPSNAESNEDFLLRAIPEGEGPFQYYWSNGGCSEACMNDPSCSAQCGYNSFPCADGAHPTCKAIYRNEPTAQTVFSRVLVIDQTDGSRKVASKITRIDCTPYDVCGESMCGTMRNNCGVLVSCGGCGPGAICSANSCIGLEEP